MTTQARDDNGVPFPVFKMGTVQKVAYTATAGAITNGVGEKTRLAIVWCSTDAHIAIGTAPTATTDDRPVTGKVDTLVQLDPGDKISAVQQSTGGTMFVTELL